MDKFHHKLIGSADLERLYSKIHDSGLEGWELVNFTVDKNLHYKAILKKKMIEVVGG